MNEFVDGTSDVAQYFIAFGSRFDGDANHDGQPRNQIVATAGFKLLGKVAAPVL